MHCDEEEKKMADDGRRNVNSRLENEACLLDVMQMTDTRRGAIS
jgi:hypothetical protein